MQVVREGLEEGHLPFHWTGGMCFLQEELRLRLASTKERGMKCVCVWCGGCQTAKPRCQPRLPQAPIPAGRHRLPVPCRTTAAKWQSSHLSSGITMVPQQPPPPTPTLRPGQDHLTSRHQLLCRFALSGLLGLLEPGRACSPRLAAGDFTRSRYIWNPLFNH